jgi:ribosomal protein L12E/L44/L45/RPP1/RPP2
MDDELLNELIAAIEAARVAGGLTVANLRAQLEGARLNVERAEEDVGPYAAALARQRDKAQQATERRADEKKSRDDKKNDNEPK